MLEEWSEDLTGKTSGADKEGKLPNSGDPILDMVIPHIVRLQKINMLLWDRESKIRKPENERRCPELKREIDALNLERNRMMEQIDQFFFDKLNLNSIDISEGLEMPYNSETLGQILDRLTILLLKKFYRLRSGEEVDEVRKIEDQIRYLARAFDNYYQSLKDGKAYMINFKQFKKYENTDFIKEEE